MDEAALNQKRFIDDRSLGKAVQLADVDDCDVLAERIPEAPFGKPAVQRHLAAFEARIPAASGARVLPFVPPTGCPAVTGPFAPTDSFLFLSRTLGGFQ